MRSRWIIAAAMIALAACSPPTVPDFTYYRLPAPQRLPEVAKPSFRHPIVVDAFAADGLYADQALVYAEQPDAQQLRQYHYQLWTDPPTRILQRRLVLELRRSNIAPAVTDELPESDPAIRIRGIILRFDRVPRADGGFNAVVSLKLRADDVHGASLVDDYYRAEKPASGVDLKSTVDAFGAAIDIIFAKFHSDLAKRGVAAGAR